MVCLLIDPKANGVMQMVGFSASMGRDCLVRALHSGVRDHRLIIQEVEVVISVLYRMFARSKVSHFCWMGMTHSYSSTAVHFPHHVHVPPLPFNPSILAE